MAIAAVILLAISIGSIVADWQRGTDNLNAYRRHTKGG